MSQGLFGNALPLITGLLTMLGTGAMLYIGLLTLRKTGRPAESQSWTHKLPPSWPAALIFLGGAATFFDGAARMVLPLA